MKGGFRRATQPQGGLYRGTNAKAQSYRSPLAWQTRSHCRRCDCVASETTKRVRARTATTAASANERNVTWGELEAGGVFMRGPNR